MKPGRLDLTIYQGATFQKALTWSTGTPSAPVDLTGRTARMQVRLDAASTQPLVSLTTENGGITLGGTAGTITLFLSPAQTAALAFGRGVYDLEIVAGSGEVRRLLEGSVTLSPEVTR